MTSHFFLLIWGIFTIIVIISFLNPRIITPWIKTPNRKLIIYFCLVISLLLSLVLEKFPTNATIIKMAQNDINNNKYYHALEKLSDIDSSSNYFSKALILKAKVLKKSKILREKEDSIYFDKLKEVNNNSFSKVYSGKNIVLFKNRDSIPTGSYIEHLNSKTIGSKILINKKISSTDSLYYKIIMDINDKPDSIKISFTIEGFLDEKHFIWIMDNNIYAKKEPVNIVNKKIIYKNI